jgi:hypothetical protein
MFAKFRIVQGKKWVLINDGKFIAEEPFIWRRTDGLIVDADTTEEFLLMANEIAKIEKEEEFELMDRELGTMDEYDDEDSDDEDEDDDWGDDE